MSTTLGAPLARAGGRNARVGMRRWCGALLAVGLALSLVSSGTPSAQPGIRTVRLEQPPPPALTAPVNDFANVITESDEAELDRRIRALQQASGDVVVVATVPSMEPYTDINEFALRMFENGGRGIGQKGKDNGALIVLALKERQVRVEVGYDLEEFITDGFAGETIRQVMTPQFRNGNYSRGPARRRDADHQPHRRAARRRAAERAARAPAHSGAARIRILEGDPARLDHHHDPVEPPAAPAGAAAGAADRGAAGTAAWARSAAASAEDSAAASADLVAAAAVEAGSGGSAAAAAAAAEPAEAGRDIAAVHHDGRRRNFSSASGQLERQT